MTSLEIFISGVLVTAIFSIDSNVAYAYSVVRLAFIHWDMISLKAKKTIEIDKEYEQK
jgi:hypothetical protein